MVPLGRVSAVIFSILFLLYPSGNMILLQIRLTISRGLELTMMSQCVKSAKLEQIMHKSLSQILLNPFYIACYKQTYHHIHRLYIIKYYIYSPVEKTQQGIQCDFYHRYFQLQLGEYNMKNQPTFSYVKTENLL